MRENEDLPWTELCSSVLNQASRRIDLSTGLVGEPSISAFPEGYLTMWDLSGSTRIIEGLKSKGQARLSEAIVRSAIDFGKRINGVLVQAPAGDNGIYFSAENPGALPMKDLLSQVERYGELPPGVLSVKAVTMPIARNSLFLGTFLSPDKKGEQVGYTALMGPAYTRGLSRLSKIGKSDVLMTDSPKPFTGAHFREIDFSKGRPNKSVTRAANILSKPQIPDGSYEHAVLWLRDPHGRASLVDPYFSASFAGKFFEKTEGWGPIKQDAGKLHIVNNRVDGDEDHLLDEMLDSLKREVGLPGLEIRVARRKVLNAVKVRVRGYEDFAGTDVIKLVDGVSGIIRT